MASVAGTQSIASWYGVCIRSFDRLCNLLRVSESEFSGQISLLALQDEIGRFRVWAGNVGAHQGGRTSLDHRLREASQVYGQVTELLSDLSRALQEGEVWILSIYYCIIDGNIQLLPSFLTRENPRMNYRGLQILQILRLTMGLKQSLEIK